MLPNPIVVSDDIVKDKDWTYNTILNDVVKLQKSNHHDLVVYNNLLNEINKNKNPQKIIAGIPELPSIDFSGLTEEDCERIGWVDVEKLVKVIFPKWNLLKPHDWNNLKDGFIEGFKAAQSLNEKKFSDKDIIKLTETRWYAEIINGVYDNKGEMETERLRHNIKADLKSLSQPKIFDIELETELRDAEEVYFEVKANHGDYLNHHIHQYDSGKITIKKEFEHIYSQPKIISNSIKITKVL